MRAVHFGGGNIGRGFIGSLLFQSGFETCFIDVNSEIVDQLNDRKQYIVKLANRTQDELIIQNVHAINSSYHRDEVIEAIVNADLVTTAVGPTILPHIAGLLAEGVKKRINTTGKPLNVIACENMIGGSTFLKEKVYENLEENEQKDFSKFVGFLDAAVDRIVPNQVNEDPLTVTVEPFYEWIVDETNIVGDMPFVKGIIFVDELKPFIERKLFTVNTGHAVAGYFGYIAGVQSIFEALNNEYIKILVEQTLSETGELLIAKYGFDKNLHDDYVQKIIDRFANPFIHDDVIRVGRSPIRKLGAHDRLINPASQYTVRFGKTPTYLTKGIAAAFHFDYKDDFDARQIQQLIKQAGIEKAIERYTQLKQESILSKAISNQYHNLRINRIK
ncbi:mannitol-1-phosphate 5-dehydrogenase [Bacillus sp. FJAT-49732]|uniref:Mannitol-1-phosphate 5-dehydrogenase n=1 Tax=Lederbergia citrisecunda TaxID=2833583 RepID=A0A942TL39_9BACI|nr:mannitol-1-phosphate 5-dehydrogenase [Lederbergia citrisecunda]MBS4198721.1 mannitol-1-phosphate 5-dehydrogenase [Lederbergia citrisecunda]